MKRTCERCKALIDVQGYGLKCNLDYKMIDGKPQEECPKPKTYNEWIYYSDLITRVKQI